jgi:uncharacterized protein YndB with AHSA1/START domain
VIPAAIEREILIDAPVEIVWRVVTEPDQIAQWFSYRADFEPRPAARGTLTFQDGGEVQLQIETIEAPRRFAFRWVHPKDSVARAGNSTLVEFTLKPEAGKTRVRVVESGIDELEWSDDDRTKFVEDHAKGWDTVLGRLRDYGSRAR